MEYQTSLFRGQPDNEAIKQIQYFEPLALEHDPRGFGVCTSEGKDSRVLGHLFRRAGVKHFYLHSITGIDPPELVYFQRRNFQHYRDLGYITHDIMYKQSIWALMLHKKFPPLRQIRYCCYHLKELDSAEQGDSIICLGVRKAESRSRMLRRDEMEIVQGQKKQSILLTFDDDENRRIFELCYRDHRKHFNPIVRWTTEDIWNYSRDVKLEQCSLYDEGFQRLGCIACPMAGEAGRRRELERWPGFRRLYLRTFQRIWDIRVQLGMTMFDHSSTAEGWFEWWLSDRAQEHTDENQLNLWT
jgi:phosphoadenosine phosphosulfate reductase